MRWKPLEPATVHHESYALPKNAPFVEAHMRQYNSTREEAIEAMERYDAECSYWRNDLYQVQKRTFFNGQFACEMVHLNIRRIDGAAIFDWRHRQLIKNQLVGEECEGFEMYPAESRLSDTSNKYHLWVFTDPTLRMPVKVNGEDIRDVVTEEVKKPAGMRQRRIVVALALCLLLPAVKAQDAPKVQDRPTFDSAIPDEATKKCALLKAYHMNGDSMVRLGSIDLSHEPCRTIRVIPLTRNAQPKEELK